MKVALVQHYFHSSPAYCHKGRALCLLLLPSCLSCCLPSTKLLLSPPLFLFNELSTDLCLVAIQCGLVICFYVQKLSTYTKVFYIHKSFCWATFVRATIVLSWFEFEKMFIQTTSRKNKAAYLKKFELNKNLYC